MASVPLNNVLDVVAVAVTLNTGSPVHVFDTASALEVSPLAALAVQDVQVPVKLVMTPEAGVPNAATSIVVAVEVPPTVIVLLGLVIVSPPAAEPNCVHVPVPLVTLPQYQPSADGRVILPMAGRRCNCLTATLRPGQPRKQMPKWRQPHSPSRSQRLWRSPA